MSDDDAASDRPPEEVVLGVEDHIDLHTFLPCDVRDVVASYLEAASQAGFAEVRLIHGRGIGVQRTIVRSLLAEHPAVEAFADAPPDRGGWGATIVRLKVQHRGESEALTQGTS